MKQLSMQRVPLFLILILCGVLLLPFALCNPLPLNDYPDHLARMYVIAHSGSSATLRSFYTVHWAIIPNLAMDLIVPRLMRLMPLQWAGALFAACAVIGLPLGAAAVSKQFFGRVSRVSLLSFLMVYNRGLLWGLLNYEFGLACAFFAFAGWLALRKRNIWTRALMLLTCGVAVFLCHLAAFGTLCVLVIAYEAYDLYVDRVSMRNAISRILGVLFPLAIAGSLILLGPTRQRTNSFDFGSLVSRISNLLYVFFAYSLWFDILTFVLVFGGLALAFRAGLLKIEPHAGLALAMLLFFYAVLPDRILGATGVGERLIIGFFFLVAAAIDFSPLASRATQQRFVALVMLLFGIRMGIVCWNWVRADRIYSSIDQAMRDIPPAQRVAPFVLQSSFPVLANPPLRHIVSSLVWEREDFVPIFAEPGQQPLQYRNPIDPLHDDSDITLDVRAGQTGLTHPFSHFHPAEFDYVVIVGRHGFPEELPSYLELVSLENDVGVYKINCYRGGQPRHRESKSTTNRDAP
jgi:hypothetical protein